MGAGVTRLCAVVDDRGLPAAGGGEDGAGRSLTEFAPEVLNQHIEIAQQDPMIGQIAILMRDGVDLDVDRARCLVRDMVGRDRMPQIGNSR